MAFEEILAGSGVTAAAVVAAWKGLCVVEEIIKKRRSGGVPNRINGTPCTMHQGLVDTIGQIHDDNKVQRADLGAIRANMETIRGELFGRMNKVEQDTSYIRGLLDSNRSRP